MAELTEQLRVIKDHEQFSSAVQQLRGIDSETATPKDALVLSGAEKTSLLKFAGLVFPGVDTSEIYAEHAKRDATGKGAHFDVYGDGLNPNYPWLAVYNLAGRVAVTAAKLPNEMADIYFAKFPEPNDDAYEARRHFSSLAFLGGADVYSGEMRTGTGMVLYQGVRGPHIIHDVVPQERSEPGEYVKLVYPANDTELSKKITQESRAVPFDELITNTFVGKESSPPASRRDTGRRRLPVIDDDLPPMPSSPCNLD